MSLFGGGQSQIGGELGQKMLQEQQQTRADKESRAQAAIGQDYARGKTMGRTGSAAFYTGTGAGYSRTLGGGNIVGVAG